MRMNQVYVLRGIPGSGKSTFAKKLQAVFQLRVDIVSADQFFESENGKWMFNPEKIGEAHAWCFRKFIRCLEDYGRTILVDNTNITAVEMAPYMLGAAAFEYKASFLNFYGISAEEAAVKNIHGVPRKTIERMYHSMVHENLPSYWGGITFAHADLEKAVWTISEE